MYTKFQSQTLHSDLTTAGSFWSVRLWSSGKTQTSPVVHHSAPYLQQRWGAGTVPFWNAAGRSGIPSGTVCAGWILGGLSVIGDRQLEPEPTVQISSSCSPEPPEHRGQVLCCMSLGDLFTVNHLQLQPPGTVTDSPIYLHQSTPNSVCPSRLEHRASESARYQSRSSYALQK